MMKAVKIFLLLLFVTNLTLFSASCSKKSSTVNTPQKPTGLTAIAGDRQVTLTWSISSGATSYNVYTSTTSGGPYKKLTSTLNTSYTVLNLTNGVSYYFVVTAVNSAGESGYSNQASITPVAPTSPPPAPTGLTATPGNSKATLTWIASTGAKGYNVYIGSTPGGPYTQIGSTSNTNYVDSNNLKNDVTCYFVVTAVNSAGESGYSNQVSVTPVVSTSAPLSPTALTAITGDTQVILKWNASSGATSYNVYTSTTSGGPYTKLTSTSNINYTVLNLTNGVTYYFVVTAVNDFKGFSESGYSNQASATPVLSIPIAPTGLTAIAGDRQVTLTWSISSGATSYNVYTSTTSGGPYTKLTSTSNTSYTVLNLTNGVTYYFVVTAVNSAGESGSSNTVSATPLAPPLGPTGLIATPSDTQVTLTWNASSGATSYNVYTSPIPVGPYTMKATQLTTSTVTGLTNGYTYYFIVQAVNSLGEGGYSNQVSATPVNPTSPPLPPTGLTAIAGDTQVNLTWSISSGATGGYNVYISTTSGGPYTKLTNTSNTSYTIPNLKNGVPYYFVVSAVNSYGESGNSNQANATPVALTYSPSAPTNLSAMSVGTNQVDLTWNESSSEATFNVTGYNVYTSTTSGGPYTKLASTDQFTTNYTVPIGLLTNGNTYYFVVSAKNSYGESGNSNEASAIAVKITVTLNPIAGTVDAVPLGSLITETVTVVSGTTITTVVDTNQPVTVSLSPSIQLATSVAFDGSIINIVPSVLLPTETTFAVTTEFSYSLTGVSFKTVQGTVFTTVSLTGTPPTTLPGISFIVVINNITQPPGVGPTLGSLLGTIPLAISVVTATVPDSNQSGSMILYGGQATGTTSPTDISPTGLTIPLNSTYEGSYFMTSCAVTLSLMGMSITVNPFEVSGQITTQGAIADGVFYGVVKCSSISASLQGIVAPYCDTQGNLVLVGTLTGSQNTITNNWLSGGDSVGTIPDNGAAGVVPITSTTLEITTKASSPITTTANYLPYALLTMTDPTTGNLKIAGEIITTNTVSGFDISTNKFTGTFYFVDPSTGLEFTTIPGTNYNIYYLFNLETVTGTTFTD